MVIRELCDLSNVRELQNKCLKAVNHQRTVTDFDVVVFEEFLERALTSQHYRSKPRNEDPLSTVYNATEFDRIVS